MAIESKTTTPPPASYGPVPTERQLIRHRDDFWGFIHFTVNTFTDREWGGGDEDPAVFQPTAFDPDQIAGVARDCGMKGLVLTCKHHDGFCLWPSRYTEHSVKNIPWREGKGDVVRDLSEACRDARLKFGVYLSPWDRNHKDYGREEYLTYYRNQLRELLTEYGPIHEVWFDGANGGDGYYGGARETRRIDARTYYDWPQTGRLVRELAPEAVMFSDIGPDIRWVGNESGFAGDPCWNALDIRDFVPGAADPEVLSRGDRNGAYWLPAECDVSIRPGWFYHAAEDGKVKTAEQLVDLYYESIGRGALLLLNLPPDRRGLVHEADIAALQGFRKTLDTTFERDLTQGATATASNTRAGDAGFAPANALDGDENSFWSTDDTITSAELVLDLAKPSTFNVVRVREFLPLGQRVDTFGLDSWQGGAWVEFASGEGIGNCRLVRTPNITAGRVRLRVSGSACPAISELGLFAAPA